jgi:hypothetical protein
MPLGSPQGPTNSEWRVIARSVDRVGEYSYPVDFTINASVDNPNDPAMEAVVQKFVDLIEGATDFVFISASRSYGYTEPMTPTA